MNREIKFRGKRVDNGEWVYGSLIICSLRWGSGYSIHTYALDEEDKDEEIEVYHPTIGQFICKSNSEQDIYEGDYDAEGNMIDYCDSCMGYQFFQIDIPTKDVIGCHNCDGDFMLHDYLSEFEPIGNIHDNPELINERSNAV